MPPDEYNLVRVVAVLLLWQLLVAAGCAYLYVQIWGP